MQQTDHDKGPTRRATLCIFLIRSARVLYSWQDDKECPKCSSFNRIQRKHNTKIRKEGLRDKTSPIVPKHGPMGRLLECGHIPSHPEPMLHTNRVKAAACGKAH